MARRREEWIDFVRGIAAIMVVLSHTPRVPYVYASGYCYIMIPIFFFVSGYVSTFFGWRDYLKTRIFKLLIIYSIYGMILPFASITELKRYINSPIEIFETLKESLLKVITGRTFWFVSCLIIVSILFCIIQILSSNNKKLLAVISFLCFGVGLVVSKPGRMFFWSADTALVCQLFYVIGFLVKEKRLLAYDYNKTFLYICTTIPYLLLVWIGCTYITSMEIVNAAINQWGTTWISVFAIPLGCCSLIHLGLIIKNNSFVNYIGRHSLIYFGFGSHGMSVANKLIHNLSNVERLSFLANPYFSTPIICLLGCVIMIPICMIIVKLFPVLDGRISKKYVCK